MNEVVCPYCYWQCQVKGWKDANHPITADVPMCFGVKEPDMCSYMLHGNFDDCPILNKEKKHEQRT